MKKEKECVGRGDRRREGEEEQEGWDMDGYRGRHWEGED